VTVTEGSEDYFDWLWLQSLPMVQETTFLKHVKVDKPIMLKIDGRKSQCVMYMPSDEEIPEKGL
jgi:hypothetical protein